MFGRVVPTAVVLCSVWTACVVAQDYPTRSIEMMVAFPAGGNTDLTARALAPELSKSLGQQVVVVNRGGAGGVIGTTELSRARPDGYTIGMTPISPLTIMPHLVDVEYDVDSFRYVCLTYDNSMILMTGPDAPFKSYEEFVAYATAGPGNDVVYASGGPGSLPHLVMDDLLRRIGAEERGVHVPYQGAGPMAQGVLEGTVMMMVESPAVATANELPVIAVFANDRLPNLPDVPTMKELGHEMEAFSAGGLVVPADTPDEVVEKLEAACLVAVESEGFQQTMENVRATSRYLPPDGFRDLAVSNSGQMRAMIEGAGLLAE